MPFLDQIVKGLNDTWKRPLLRFGKIRMFGISEVIYEPSEQQKRYPAMIDEFGEGQMIDPNDDFSLTIYHKLDSITNTIVTADTYGRAKGLQKEVANMTLMCISFRTQVLKPSYWIENVIKDALPDRSEMTNGIVTNYFAGNSGFDKSALLLREYSDRVELRYPDLQVFEMKYRIESTWSKGCFVNNN